MTAAPEFEGFADFGEAADAILRMMHEVLQLQLWLVARVHDGEWIVLHSYGEGAFKAGDVLPLSATICSEMLAGNGPHIAPDVSKVPAYAAAPVMRQHPAGCYAGAPLIVGQSVFGVLCGLSSTPVSDAALRQAPHLATTARTLSTILGGELETEALTRRVERAENEALIDELTGLYNRRGWDELVRHEESRARRFGHKHAVFFMDIDGLKEINDTGGHSAGDDAIVRAAAAIRSVTREHDVAARMGGDEFALLAVETDDVHVLAVGERLAAAFAASGVAVSVGFARADTPHDLAGATHQADQAMYRRKGERRR
jgi:diguanylate cyclase (GGDEF)-like protein